MDKFGWNKFKTTGKVEDYIKMKKKEKAFIEEFGSEIYVDKKLKGNKNVRKSRGDST